jgi:glycosyltransferase involved in cell wall biosynthesis
MKPTLSVLLPTFNHAHLVGRAIDAIGSQSRPPEELVVVDDASTDKTPEVLAALAKKYPFMQVIRNAKNLGVAGAANEGLRRITGDFIYGAASDDWVLPGAFEKAMALAGEYPQAGAICGAMYMLARPPLLFRARSWTRSLYAPPDVFVREYLDVEGPAFALGAATFFRRAPFLEIGGLRRELGSYCDSFAFRALGATHGVGYVPEPLVVWNVLPESFSQTTARDPRKYLEVVTRVAALMRTAPFDRVFPKEHTDRWEREYREEILSRAAVALTESVERIVSTRPLLGGGLARGATEPLLESLSDRMGSRLKERLRAHREAPASG